jgi:regulator of replication initiation timing
MTVRDPNRLLMQTPHEALAEARAEIMALLEENRLLREELQRLKRRTPSGDKGE